MYSTAQFKIERTCMQQGHDTTRFSICMRVGLRARKVDDVKPTVQNSRVHTRRVHNACMHFRNAHTKFRLRVQTNCKPRKAE